MLGVLCIIGFPVQLIREVFFRDYICRRRRHTFASLWGACLRFAFASLWPTNSRGDSCVLERLSFILFSQSVHLWRVCWIFVKRTYFKSLLKVYYRSVFAESFKTFMFQKFQRPLCHKVNLLRCEARRRRLIMICDIFGTGQTNILGLCYLFGKTYKQPTVAPLKSLKSTHSTKLPHLLRRTIRYH